MFDTGTQLRNARKQASLTLDQLAARSSIDRGTISRIELGHVSPRIDTLICLCEAMNTTLPRFFGGEPGTAPWGEGKSRSASRPSVAVADGPSPFLDPATGTTPYWPIPADLWQSLISVAERFEVLMAHSGELVMVLDPEGRIGYLSPGGRRLLGMGSHDFLGTSARELLHVDDRARFISAFMDASPSTAKIRKYRFRHKEGAWLTFDCTLTNHLRTPSIQAVILNASPTAPAQ